MESALSIKESIQVTVIGRLRLVAALSFVLVLVSGGAVPASASAACPNETLRTGSSAQLPDCRAYEQVTPTDKDGTNPTGGIDNVAASPNGGRVIYLVPADMPGAQGSSNYPNFLSSRASEAWTSAGMLPLSPPGFSDAIIGWSEDLSSSVIRAVVPGEEDGDAIYLRDDETDALQALTGTFPGHFFSSAALVGITSTGGTRVFLETREPLLPNAAPGDNLYEWHNGSLALVGLLPASEGGAAPPEGSFAGPYEWQSGITTAGGTIARYYTQNTISSNGSRVFFTAAGSGQLYVRENGTATVRASASQRAIPDPNGPRPAAFMAATPDGSDVYFTSCEKLTEDSTAVSTAEPSCTESAQGQDLYAYDVNTGMLHDLTVDNEPGDSLGAAVQGVLGAGVSEDGTESIYFVANGVLAPGAKPGDCHGISTGDTHEGLHCNLYAWRGGVTTFIAELNAELPLGAGSNLSDAYDWLGETNEIGKTARVSTNGEAVLFDSRQQLTPYANDGIVELYRFGAAGARLTCISCNPDGQPPSKPPSLRSISNVSITVNAAPTLTRNLSETGSRVFFESSEGLTPEDTNGTQNVYEWETSGTGSCTSASENFVPASGGCLISISTGRSPAPSYFGDASASGNDVFIFTEQGLVAQDTDSLVDVYDARVDGGIAAQNEAAVAPCEGEGCRGAAVGSQALGTPASVQFSGSGNLAPSAPPSAKPKAKPLTRAQKLARALKACKKDKKRARRGRCEKQARKQFGTAKQAKRAGNERRGE